MIQMFLVTFLLLLFHQEAVKRRLASISHGMQGVLISGEGQLL